MIVLARTPLTGNELLGLHLDQQQLAGQRTVPERILLVTAQAHALAQFRRAGEYRRLPAQAGLAQTLAKVLVEVQQAGFVAQAFAVWRVADHQALLILVRARLETAQLALIDLHPVGQAGTLDVIAPRLDQARVGFVTTNPQRRLGQPHRGALLGLGMQLLPDCRHMAQPIGEAPTLTLEIGGDIGSHQRCLHQEGTYTAHRVGQRAALGGNARPTGTDQHCRRQVLFQRRRSLLQAVTTLVQAVAGEVQGQHRLTAIQAQMHAQVRVELVDAGTLAAGRTQPVDDRILDLECAEVGVVDP